MTALRRPAALVLLGVAGVLAIVATSPPPPARIDLAVDAQVVCRGEQLTLTWVVEEGFDAVPDDVTLATVPTDAFEPPLHGVPLGPAGARTVTALAPAIVGVAADGWWAPVGVDAMDCDALGYQVVGGVLPRALSVDADAGSLIEALAAAGASESRIVRRGAGLQVELELVVDGSVLDVAAAAAGRLAVTGTELAAAPEGGWRPFVAVLEADGAVAWREAFGAASPPTVLEAGTAIAIAPNGDVLAAGQRRGDASLEGFVRRYDADGALIWDHAIATGGDVLPRGLAVGSDGSAFVAGTTEAPFPGATQLRLRDVFLRAIDPDGGEAWTVQPGGFGRTAAVALAGDRTLLLGPEPMAFEVDGSEAWRADVDDAHVPVAATSDGAGGVWIASLVVTTAAFPPSLTVVRRDDVLLRRYDAAGSVLSEAIVGSLGDEDVLAIAAWPAGGDSLAIAGTTTGSVSAPFAGPQPDRYLLVVVDGD